MSKWFDVKFLSSCLSITENMAHLGMRKSFLTVHFTLSIDLPSNDRIILMALTLFTVDNVTHKRYMFIIPFLHKCYHLQMPSYWRVAVGISFFFWNIKIASP